MVWGWLPCGLVYSALALAATAGNIIQSALTMLFFRPRDFTGSHGRRYNDQHINKDVQNATLQTGYRLVHDCTGLAGGNALD